MVKGGSFLCAPILPARSFGVAPRPDDRQRHEPYRLPLRCATGLCRIWVPVGLAVSATAIGLIVFVLVFGSALLAMLVHRALPEHHLSADSKDVVKLGIALIATMSALVQSAGCLGKERLRYAEQPTGPSLCRYHPARPRFGPLRA